jgi:uncharacterized protein (DUF2141 family)
MHCEKNQVSSFFYCRFHNLCLIDFSLLVISKRLAWLIIAIISITPSITIASDLTVEVLGVRSNEGLVHFGLYNKSSNFLKADSSLDGTSEVIINNRSVFVFKGLSPGYYALAVYHDENSNGEFDQILFGIPVEDYGFSNDAVAFFGPPDFKDAKVHLD